MSDGTEKLVGKVLSSVTLSPDKETVTFRCTDGEDYAFGVQGDCCSVSWIEHLEMPDNVLNATVTQILRAEMDGTDKLMNCREDGTREHESLAVYNTTFRTDRGDIVLEFRNSSNGYYGGYIVEKKVE